MSLYLRLTTLTIFFQSARLRYVGTASKKITARQGRLITVYIKYTITVCITVINLWWARKHFKWQTSSSPAQKNRRLAKNRRKKRGRHAMAMISFYLTVRLFVALFVCCSKRVLMQVRLLLDAAQLSTRLTGVPYVSSPWETSPLVTFMLAAGAHP